MNQLSEGGRRPAAGRLAKGSQGGKAGPIVTPAAAGQGSPTSREQPVATPVPQRTWGACIPRLAACAVLLAHPAAGAELPEVAARIKPALVGVGTFQKTRSPALRFMGTGFAVGDGRLIVTNAHVIPPALDAAARETLVVLAGRGSEPDAREATVIATDPRHDLALVRISGAPLTPLTLADSDQVREGQQMAFSGFPLGLLLGLYPATHRATLAAIVPIARPQANARQLNEATVARIRGGAFTVFQLDGTAYPGSSGSPLYDPASGEVVGVINMVFVKGTREAAISNPSGITYAIPANYIRELLKGNSAK